MATKKTTTKSGARTTTKKASAGQATKGSRGRKTTAKRTPVTKPAAKKSKPASSAGKKLSAIDAAAQVLSASKEPMNAKQMIEAMAAKKLWTSPGGKTPHATLYSAVLREIQTKGKDSRFKKTERGKFAAKG